MMSARRAPRLPPRASPALHDRPIPPVSRARPSLPSQGRYYQPLNIDQPESTPAWNLHHLVTHPTFWKEARELRACVLTGVPEGIPHLAEFLTQSRRFRVLGLEGAPLTVENTTRLARGLAGNRSLKRIDLSFNEMGDEQAIVLAASLQGHPTLKVLNLTSNDIGARGAQALAQMLETLPKIECVSVYNNPLGDEGAHVLGKSLIKLKKCTQVYFDKSKLTSKALKALAQSAFLKPNLEEVSLRGNKIDEEALPELIQLVRKPKLIELDLKDNAFKDARAVLAKLRRHRANPKLQISA